MARELIKKHIDGQDYEFQQFGAKQSLKLLMRLSKIIGKPLALAVASSQGQGKVLDREVNMDLLSQAVEALTSNLHEDEALDLIQAFTGGAALMCNGKQIDFNSHYEGRLDHLFKVLWAALEVQYGNFFGALSAVPGMARIQNRDTTPAPQT